MGFTPRQVKAMTLWEFIACRQGFKAAHSPKPEQPEAEVPDEVLRQLGIEGF